MIRLLRKVFYSALSLAVLLPGYAAAANTNENLKEIPPAEVILRVNGKEFTNENLSVAVSNLIPAMSFHSSVSDQRLKEIQKTAIDQMINGELTYEAAKKEKMTNVSNKDIDAEIENLKKRLPKGTTLDKVLKNSKMTMADLRDDFKRKLIIKNYTQKKNDEFKKKSADTVNEAYLKDYYQKNLEKFKEPEQIRLRSILVKADPAGGQRVWNESLKKAKEIAKRAKGGEDFAKLAEKVSEDPYAKNGGDMGWAHKGSLFQEIDDAAAKMKVGEISDPVMTIYGYHILKLEARKPSVQKKFEELNRDKLKAELEAKEYKRLWDDWIKALRSTAKIEYPSKDFQEIK